jgi:carboxylesterase type B
MGVNLNEANYFYAYAFEEYRNFTQQPTLDDATYKDHLANIFHFYPQYPLTSTNETQSQILSTYSYTTNNFNQLDKAGSDFNFKCPQNRLAHYYESSSVFFYYFTQLSDKFNWPEWLGVLHTNEIPFTFGVPLNQSKMYDEESKVLSRKMLKYWSNFVRFSTPNEKSKRPKDVVEVTQTLQQIIEFWPRFTKKNNFPYIVLNSNVTQNVGYNLRAEYCSFWENLS